MQDMRMDCDCFSQGSDDHHSEVTFHVERQDTTCDAWQHLLELIEEAAADRREEFAPLKEISWEERSQIVTLPPTIAKLKSVKCLLLYGSHLIRIPPEIGEMTSLEEFVPYTSYQLHWFPYEITRCRSLKDSCVSTRAIYGNYKHRPPFPSLQPGRSSTKDLQLDNLLPEIWGAESIKTCSVCNRPLAGLGLYQVWISLSVATDVLPLLVNACSEACIQRLPQPADNHVQEWHKGGLGVEQPPTYLISILGASHGQ